MDKEFWLQRWQNKQLGFQLDQAHPLLVEHWTPLIGATNKISVPLCGKAPCLHFLRHLETQVHGFEISQVATQAFFAEAKLVPKIHHNELGYTASYDKLTLHCGDYFAQTEQGFDAFYDRAGLIALPPEMRPKYVQTLAQSLTDNAQGLLITLEHNSEKSPPFSISVADVCALYKAEFEVEHIESHAEKNVPGGIGVEHLLRLRKKPCNRS